MRGGQWMVGNYRVTRSFLSPSPTVATLEAKDLGYPRLWPDINERRIREYRFCDLGSYNVQGSTLRPEIVISIGLLPIQDLTRHPSHPLA